MNGHDRIPGLGFCFFNGSLELSRPALFYGTRSLISIEFANTQTLVLANQEKDFREAYESFDFICIDGVPLKWAIQILSRKSVQLNRGPDFFERVIFKSTVHLRHFIIGGNQQLAYRLNAKLKNAPSNAEIVGWDFSYFNLPFEKNQLVIDEIAKQINLLKPDFIWVALGTPKQQLFIAKIKEQISTGCIVSIGFGLDVVSGVKKDAPRVMINLGLAWMFRLLQEPKRLMSRYLIYNSKFIVLFFKYLVRLKK